MQMYLKYLFFVLGEALTPYADAVSAMLSILFNNVKGCLRGGLGGILTDSLVMLNDFQLAPQGFAVARGQVGRGGGH